ncbi:major strawberry allergen Fra a 1-3-like [Eucalyptus grandis]|uniref:Bet v I/Major latex protein domain-containing protein n=1 Tax=Eucalyptus globulus TaxID=34317 RepID=A0ABD3JW95_EUCGL|nr:major strawberry allergen Fra a 1-3-like [Eucalyptus grandis]
MGVITYSQEFASVVAPSRMFKALVLDSHNIIPKIVPGGIKSVEFIEGDGGVGSIKQTNFSESAHIKYTKHKIDALDVENFYCKYTLIESDIKFDKIKFIVYEVKFASANDGCVCKMTSEYDVEEGAELKEDDIKQGKDRAMGLFKTVEEYLLANPTVCA